MSDHTGPALPSASAVPSASGRMAIYTTVCGALWGVEPFKGDTGKVHELSLDADESE